MGFKTFAAAAAVAVFSAIQCAPMFLGRITWNTSSIEVAHITQAKLLAMHWPTPGWNPLWYGGHPFKLAYHPMFLFIVNAAAIILNTGVIEAYRRVAAFSLILLPVAVYFFVYSLSRSASAGFLTSIVLIGAQSIHSTILTYPHTATAPSHVTVLALYGETPHILGLGLAFIAAALYNQYISSGRKMLGLATTLTIALVLLTNLVAAVSLTVLLLVLALISGWEEFKKLVVAYVFGLGVCLFAYDHEYLQALLAYIGSGSESRPITAPDVALIIALIIIILLTAYALAKTVQKKTKDKLIPSAMMLSIVFTLVVVFYKFMGIELLPQAGRYRYGPEFDAAVIMLAVTSAYKLAQKSEKIVVVMSGTIVFAGLLYLQTLPAVWTMLRPGDSVVANSLEMKTIDYIKSLPGDVFGPRVYATGSIAFWLNVYADKPQVRGGFDTAGAVTPMWSHITYLVNTSPNGSLAVSWLRAFNVRYVVVDMPSAPLPYKDYKHPEKFENLLPTLKQIDGIKIYETDSDLKALKLVKKPRTIPVIKDVLDFYGLHNYLLLVEDKCDATLQYHAMSNNLIEARVDNLTEDCILLFKTNHDHRWRAYVNGRELRPEIIGPNFMYFDLAAVRGPAEVKIKYMGEDMIDWVFNALSLAFLTAAILNYTVFMDSKSKFKPNMK
ncbi:MAG: hypothetical protein QXR47_04170 [Candidatus Caldarchaeum sp.]